MRNAGFDDAAYTSLTLMSEADGRWSRDQLLMHWQGRNAIKASKVIQSL